MSFLSGLFGGGDNPADAAQPFLNQIPGTLTRYLSPYVNMGQQVMPQYQQQIMALLQNPTSLMNQIGQGYQQSPGYNFQLQQSLNAANQAAAAGGQAGTMANQYQAQNIANNLANQDYWNYVNHGLGMYQQGLGGLGGLNQMGFDAASGLAENLSSSLMSQANLAYAGQANQNQMNQGMFGALLGAGVSLAPLFF